MTLCMREFSQEIWMLINPWIEHCLKRMDSRMRILNLGVRKMLKRDELGVSGVKR